MTKLFSLMRDCKERSLKISGFDHTSRWCNSCPPVASWRYYQVSKPFVGHGANFFLQFLAAPWWRPFRFHCHPQGKIWVIISFICDNNPKKRKQTNKWTWNTPKLVLRPRSLCYNIRQRSSCIGCLTERCAALIHGTWPVIIAVRSADHDEFWSHWSKRRRLDDRKFPWNLGLENSSVFHIWSSATKRLHHEPPDKTRWRLHCFLS